jgi:hypothetical protein
LRGLQNDVSTALEAKKNHAVALLEERLEADKTAVLLKEREDTALALAQMKATVALKEAQKGLNSVVQSIGLLNRLSYCKILSYQSSLIEVEAVLSTSVRVQISFNLSLTEGDVLQVMSTSVALKQDDKTKASIDSDSALAKSFYSNVMCSEELLGPLSQRNLSSVTAPADVRTALRTISGYVSMLRRVSTWLACFAKGQWSWSIDGEEVRIKFADKVVLSLPLRVLVSGDINGLLEIVSNKQDCGVSLSESSKAFVTTYMIILFVILKSIFTQYLILSP